MTKQTVLEFLTGEHTHYNTEDILANCSWELTGQLVGVGPHSIFRILNHIIFWQDVYLGRIEGAEIDSPGKPSTGWPGPIAPPDEAVWKASVNQFKEGLHRAQRYARERDLGEIIPSFRGASLGDCLVFLALHNSHHMGQIITLRQILGDWPAPVDQW